MNNTSLSKAGVASAGTLGTLFDMSGMFLISPVLVAKPSVRVALTKSSLGTSLEHSERARSREKWSCKNEKLAEKEGFEPSHGIAV